MAKNLSPLAICLTCSLLALAAAIVAEFHFDMAPCILCLAQRVPHVLAIVCIGAAIMLSRQQRSLCTALALVYLAGSATGIYQVGVEQAWWGINDTGEATCTTPDTRIFEIEKLYENMSGNPLGDCSQPEFAFHGITFAGMNALLCLLLAIVAFYGRRNYEKKIFG
jgi:disulfide bond formation protein DsbB